MHSHMQMQVFKRLIILFTVIPVFVLFLVHKATYMLKLILYLLFAVSLLFQLFLVYKACIHVDAYSFYLLFAVIPIIFCM
jgi:hypothetical protein